MYGIWLDWIQERGEDETMSFTSFMKLKPFWIVGDYSVESCVCVYHRQFSLFIKGLNECRGKVHKSKCVAGPNPRCQNHASCPCQCSICVPGWERSNYTTPFIDSVMCPREQGSSMYRLKCVKLKCDECGWSKKQGACPVDERRAECEVSVNLLKKQEVDTTTGTKKNIKIECLERMQYRTFMDKMENELKFFVEHDFVAR